jgi:6-phosphofructokinase
MVIDPIDATQPESKRADTMKRLGLLTSGGDCAGLNAAIRAVVKRAVTGYGAEVVGILQGTRGLMERPVKARPLDLAVFTGDILRQGGTMLGTVNKGNPFTFPDGKGGVSDRSAEVLDGIRGLGLDALIGIGGDGSMRILKRLADQGNLPFVGIPKTIDNDVPGTEMCIGYHTAVATAVEALDRLQPTAASHQRVMVLEVMGRDAGHIALAAGIAGGADVILIPEIPYDAAAITAKLASVTQEGRNHALVICAEAANISKPAPIPAARRITAAPGRSWGRRSPGPRGPTCGSPCWAMCSAAACRPASTGFWPRPSAFMPWTWRRRGKRGAWSAGGVAIPSTRRSGTWPTGRAASISRDPRRARRAASASAWATVDPGAGKGRNFP